MIKVRGPSGRRVEGKRTSFSSVSFWAWPDPVAQSWSVALSPEQPWMPGHTNLRVPTKSLLTTTCFVGCQRHRRLTGVCSSS